MSTETGVDVQELALVRVPGAADLADGEVRAATAGGRKVVVVRVGDERFASENRCLHLGVRLSDGHLDGTVLECRWHHWRFDFDSGAVDAADGSFESFTTYPVSVDGADLLIDPRPRTRVRRRDADDAAAAAGGG